jgi:hypothetical protein
MANPTMVILRGNDSPAGTFPDEKGEKIAWPIGALHVQAASGYARKRGYEPLVLDVSGRPNNSQHTAQVKAALKAFHEDASVAAFYGFSGGGYNLVHILDYLSAKEPDSLLRIKLVVVIGSPNKYGRQGKTRDLPAKFNSKASWEVVFRENPTRAQLPEGLPDGTPPHMFGPDVLLSGWIED